MVQFDFANNLETAVNDMEQLRKYIDHMGPYAAALLKWIVVGGLVGGVGGVVGALFHLGVNYATSVRLAHPWVLYLLPLGALSSPDCIGYVNWRARAPTPSSNRYTSAPTYRCCWCR